MILNSILGKCAVFVLVAFGILTGLYQFQKNAVLKEQVRVAQEATESLRTGISKVHTVDTAKEAVRRSEAQETASAVRQARNLVQRPAIVSQGAPSRVASVQAQKEQEHASTSITGHAYAGIDPEFRRLFNNAVRAGNSDYPAGLR